LYRFSRDAGLHYTYCDSNTGNGIFDPAFMVRVNVSPPP